MAHDLLNGLSSAEAEQVLELGTRMIVPSGTLLFRLGDSADRLFLIECGGVRLTLPMEIRGQDKDILVEERLPGQTVGWSALIPPYRFTLSATASSDTEVIALPRESLREYFAAHPAAGCKLSLNLAVVIGHRLQLFQTIWLREMGRTVQAFSA
jgi:CRP/FNR family transcriptional regulator, cyclic AMP receptor protein